MITLVQEFGAHAGRVLTFQKDRVRLGRAPDNDIAFDAHADLDASAYHCELVRQPEGWILFDTSSRNGTFLNNQRVSRERVRVGDRLSCGRTGPRLRVEQLETPPEVLPATQSGDDVNARRQNATRLMLIASVILLLVSFLATVYLVMPP